jgi:chromosome partitioning protein
MVSQKVYIPVQTEFYALEGIVELLDTIDIVTHRMNEDLQIGGIFATMVDSRSKLHIEVVGQLKEFFGEQLFKTLIRRNVKIAERRASINQAKANLHKDVAREIVKNNKLSKKKVEEIHAKIDEVKDGEDFTISI